MEPLAPECFAGAGGIIPVTRSDAVAPYADFSCRVRRQRAGLFLHNANVEAGAWPSGRASAVGFVVAVTGDETCFRHSITLIHAALEGLLKV